MCERLVPAPRRRFQYSLRTLLLFVLGLGFVFLFALSDDNGGWSPIGSYGQHNAATAVISRDETRAIVGTKDGRILILQMQDQRQVASLNVGLGPVEHVGISGSGHWGLGSTGAGPVHIFECATGTSRYRISRGKEKILSVCLSSDASLAAVFFADGSLVLRNLASGAEHVYALGRSKDSYLCFSEDTSTLWVGAEIGSLICITTATNQLGSELKSTSLPLSERRIAMAWTDERLVDIVQENYTRIWTRTGDRIVGYGGTLWTPAESDYQFRSSYNCGRISRDGQVLVSGSTVWSTSGGRRIASLDLARIIHRKRMA